MITSARHHIITAVLAIVAFAASAQNKVFEQISEMQEAQYFYISKGVLSSLNNSMAPLAVNIAPAVHDLNSLEVLSCDKPEAFDKIRRMLLPSVKKLQLLSHRKHQSAAVEIYGRRNGDHLAELLYITHDTTSLSAIYMTGDIDTEVIKSMTRQPQPPSTN